MRTCICSLAFALGLCTVAAAAQPATDSSGLKPDGEGWISLFDGKNLDAWQKPATEKWKIVDGVLTKDKRVGNLWTKDTFGDFTVDLEVKCVEEHQQRGVSAGTRAGLAWAGDSGPAFLRQPQAGETRHGHLYDCVAPSVAAEKALGQWNHMVIAFVGNNLKITLNDKPIIDANLDQWTEAHKNPDGSVNKFDWALKDCRKPATSGCRTTACRSGIAISGSSGLIRPSNRGDNQGVLPCQSVIPNVVRVVRSSTSRPSRPAPPGWQRSCRGTSWAVRGTSRRARK